MKKIQNHKRIFSLGYLSFWTKRRAKKATFESDILRKFMWLVSIKQFEARTEFNSECLLPLEVSDLLSYLVLVITQVIEQVTVQISNLKRSKS